MNFFKQSTEQAREAFTALPVQSRVISIMLVATIAIGLAFLIRGDGKPSKDILFGGQSFGEQELAAIELAFSRAGLNDWEREGRRIRIPRETKATYLAALEESSTLPMSLRSSVQDALNAMSVFDSSDLLVARQMHAKEQDLSKKIAKFHDVRWASVEYDRGERRGLSRSRPQSASVVIEPEGTAPLPRQRIMAIKELIRGSYAEMSGDDVVVIDTNSSSSSSLSDDDDPLLRKQRETEARVEQKVRSLLIGYPVRVAVSAEIDPTMSVEKTILKYDAEPTNLTNKTRKVESSSNQPPNRGVPGTLPNAISNRAQSLDEPVEASKSKEDERETSGVAGQQYENSRVASLQVKKIRVSVGLPASYYQTIHGQEYLRVNPDVAAADVPPIDDETLEKIRTKTSKNIRSAVTVLLPEVSAGANPDPLVEVWDYPDFPEPAQPGPDTVKTAMAWLAEVWQTIALVMLALVALLVARSAAKATGDSSPREFREGFGLKLPNPPPESDETDEDLDAMNITGGTLKDELVMIVDDNPEVAANVIRGWVGEAA